MKRKIQNVIFGAGINGLYLALKLIEQGVSLDQVIVFDPRQGTYLRPGHIDLRSLSRIVLKSGPLFIEDISRYYHIKDVERALYALAIENQIQMESKSFLCFNDATNAIGVMVGAAEGIEELIECEYVYDCTGEKREIIQTVNAISREERPPFILSPVPADLPHHHYVLANIKIHADDVEFVQLAIHKLMHKDIFNQTALEFTKHIRKLHDLGWTGAFYPLTTLYSITDEKSCFYSEAPEHLPQDSLMDWVSAVLMALTNTRIEIDQLKPSVKFGPKKDRLRLMQFDLSLDYLRCYSYQGKGLPMVIPQGDTVHSPHFYLRQGIAFGATRINKLLRSLKIDQGLIIQFDRQDYHEKMMKLKVIQTDEQLDFIKTRTYYLFSALSRVERMYREAMTQTEDLDEKAMLESKHHEVSQLIEQKNAQAHTYETPSSHPSSFFSETDILKEKLQKKFNYYAKISIEFRHLNTKAAVLSHHGAFEDAFNTYIDSAKKLALYAEEYPAERQHILPLYASILKTYTQLSRKNQKEMLNIFLKVTREALLEPSHFFHTAEIKEAILLIAIHQLYKQYKQQSKNPFFQALMSCLIDTPELLTPSLFEKLGDSAIVLTWIHPSIDIHDTKNRL